MRNCFQTLLSISTCGATTGRLLAEEHGHCASVLSLTFSADGGTLVSGGEDGIIMLWKVDARK